MRWAFALLAAACGADPAPITQLSFRASYQVVGVARELPNGMTPASLRAIEFEYQSFASSGGRLAAKLVAGGREASISGEVDPVSGDFVAEPLDFALTSTGAERVVELGGRGFDGTPPDGVVDDMSGFLRVEWPGTPRALQAYTVGTAPAANAPAAPELSKITASRLSLGRAKVLGGVGAITPRSAVEMFVHGLAIAPPKLELVTSKDDGSFVAEIDADVEDVLILRARNVGIAGPARALVVTE